MSLLVRFRLPIRHTQQAATSGMLKDGYIDGSIVGELLDEIYVIRDKIVIDMLI